MTTDERMRRGGTFGLTLGALGVVFGDIGTSPLYAVQEVFGGPHDLAPDRQSVFGVLSLIFWALVIIVTLKYVLLVMRADSKPGPTAAEFIETVRSAAKNLPRL